MAWIWLLAAGLCEIAWAIGLKYADGFTRWRPTVWTIVLMILSFFLLAKAMRTLPVGTAYAVWTGIGAAGFEEWRHGAAYGIYLAVVAAMMVEQTERGDQMFITSTTRHVQHTLELGTFEPYGSTS